MSYGHIWVKFSTLIPDSIFIHCWFLSLNLLTNHRGLGDPAREEWLKEETENPSPDPSGLQPLNHLPHLATFLHFSYLVFYSRCCGGTSSCCPCGILQVLKYVFQRHHQLKWETQLCHGMGPLKTAGNSWVQHGAASGLLIQRPPLQLPAANTWTPAANMLGSLLAIPSRSWQKGYRPLWEPASVVQNLPWVV